MREKKGRNNIKKGNGNDLGKNGRYEDWINSREIIWKKCMEGNERKYWKWEDGNDGEGFNEKRNFMLREGKINEWSEGNDGKRRIKNGKL